MEDASSPISANDGDEIKQTIGWFDLPFEMREMVMEKMTTKTKGSLSSCSNDCLEEVRKLKNFIRKLDFEWKSDSSVLKVQFNQYRVEIVFSVEKWDKIHKGECKVEYIRFMVTREYLEGVLQRFKNDEEEDVKIMARGADLPVNPHKDEPAIFLSRRIFVIIAQDRRIRDKERIFVYHEDTLIEHWAFEVEFIQREMYVEKTADVYRVNEFGLMAPECRERRNEVVLHPQGKYLVPAPNREYLSAFIPVRNAHQFSAPINYVITYYRECYSEHQKNFMNWVRHQNIPRGLVRMSHLNNVEIQSMDTGEPSTIIVEVYQQDEEQLALFNVPFLTR